MINEDTRKKISFERVIQIISSGDSQYAKYSGDEETIYFEGYIIETKEKYFVFHDEIDCKLRLEFKECSFAGQKVVFIMGMTCQQYVTFDDCHFSDGIYIQSGTFLKELAFKKIRTTDFHLTGGTFSTITFSAYEVRQFWLSGGKFELLDIGYWVGGDNLGDLVIFNNKGELGNIRVRSKRLNKLSLHGTNLNKSFDFRILECSEVLIADFTNTGELNFFGLRPTSGDQSSYFQIINSNLNKAQFYQTIFGQYTEFIIIDSYIIDCLFIGCQWASNVRALRGPGYDTFKKSLEGGRKIENAESYGIKEAYRQLKLSMNKHSDKVQETAFYAKEMNLYNQLLKWFAPWKNAFWDKVILHFSRIFSNYGQSFLRPLFWLLAGHLLFFIVALALNGFWPLHISFAKPTSDGFKIAFERYFIYINPLRRLETSLSGYLILLDLLMRIWSSYMIYNIVRATRRFIT
jgi:hypothetical protein